MNVHPQPARPAAYSLGKFAGNRLLTNLQRGRRKFDVEKTIAEEVVYHQGAWAVDASSAEERMRPYGNRYCADGRMFRQRSFAQCGMKPEFPRRISMLEELSCASPFLN